MTSTTRKRVLVASIAGIALIGSGVGTAALASSGESPNTSTSAATNSGSDLVATVGNGTGNTNGDTTGQQPKLSEKQAVQIARAEVPGTVTEVDLDDDDGQLHWEIEIDGKDNREHDLDIAADDGTILEHDIDARDDDRGDRDNDDDRDDDDRNDDDRNDQDDDGPGDDDDDDRDDD